MIRVKVAKKSNNIFELKVGALYPMLHGMVQSGYLESYNQEVNGKLRKYYCITVNGKKYLERMIEEWNAYRNAMNDVLCQTVKITENRIIVIQPGAKNSRAVIFILQ